MGFKTMKAVIFFGHGARDARWREPFDRLVMLWGKEHPEIPAHLAFLEMMSPSLADCVGHLCQQGINEIKVIPVFFGQGGHLRNDFPKILAECRTQFPDVSLSTSSAVGESDLVLRSIIDFTMDQFV
jgi:sirohydrochlorin cobaltochelatase